LGNTGNWVAAQASHTSAHDLAATVAPFQAWRISQLIIARGPTRATIASAALWWLSYKLASLCRQARLRRCYFKQAADIFINKLDIKPVYW